MSTPDLRLMTDASVDLWVMENAGKKKWSNKTVVLPLSQMNFAPSDKLGMQGTSRCNEVRLAMIKRIPTTEPRRSVIYDLEKNKITRKLEVKPLPHLWCMGVKKGDQTTFWEDIESIMYLET